MEKTEVKNKEFIIWCIPKHGDINNKPNKFFNTLRKIIQSGYTFPYSADVHDENYIGVIIFKEDLEYNSDIDIYTDMCFGEEYDSYYPIDLEEPHIVKTSYVEEDEDGASYEVKIKKYV